MRFTLRSLLIAATIGPPLLAWFWLNPLSLAFLVAFIAPQLCAFVVLYLVAIVAGRWT